MKKVFAAAVVGIALVATAAVSTRPSPAEPEVDLNEVNARIDARLHLVLGRLIEERK